MATHTSQNLVERERDELKQKVMMMRKIFKFPRGVVLNFLARTNVPVSGRSLLLLLYEANKYQNVPGDATCMHIHVLIFLFQRASWSNKRKHSALLS
jgi:hypothetical protein